MNMDLYMLEVDIESGTGVMSIENFSNQVDTSKVKYYSLERVDGYGGASLIISFLLTHLLSF
jgi:hypothetical protein